MEEKIVIIDGLDFARHNLNKIKEIAAREEAAVVPLSDSVYLFLLSEGVNCIDYRKFEKSGMSDDVYPTARLWGTGWYKPDNADLTAVDSRSLGSIVEWAMIYYFSHVLRLHLFISEMIMNIRPKEILFIASYGPDSQDHFMRMKDIDTDTLLLILRDCIERSVQSIKLNIQRLPHPDVRQKDRTNYVRKVFFYLNIPFSYIFRAINIIAKKDKKIVFFEGFRHFHRIMNQPRFKRVEIIHLQKNIGPSLFLDLYRKGIRIESMRSVRLKKSPGISFDLSFIAEKLSDFFIYRGRNLFGCVWPRLETIFSKHLQRVYDDLCRASFIMKKIKPCCVVVENDSTYYEKLIVTAAKELGAYTVVIQNGATLFHDAYKNNGLVIHDFYPLNADRFFSFSKISRDWFMNMRVDQERVIITGGPRFDTYYGTNKNRDVACSGRRTVLILLNDLWQSEGVVNGHIRLNVFYKHVIQFINLARRNSDIDFIVRSHSEDNLWNRIFKKELSGLSNLALSRQECLKNIFLRTDLVMGYASTALIEALIMRIPVISLDTGDFYNSFPLWEYSLSSRISSFEELDAEIKRLIFCEKDRRLAVELIQRNVHLLNYNDDGMASERSACELVKISSVASGHRRKNIRP